MDDDSPLKARRPYQREGEGMEENGERIIRTTCASHCGGTCVLRVHVKEGAITRIESDDGEEPRLRG